MQEENIIGINTQSPNQQKQFGRLFEDWRVRWCLVEGICEPPELGMVLVWG